MALTEGRHTAECILSEANGQRSREVITVLSGEGVLVVGTVLAKVTASGKYVAAVASAADGSQTAVAVLLEQVDATSADAEALVLARDAEVNGNTLTYDSSVDDGTKKAAKVTQLTAVGIIVR